MVFCVKTNLNWSQSKPLYYSMENYIGVTWWKISDFDAETTKNGEKLLKIDWWLNRNRICLTWIYQIEISIVHCWATLQPNPIEIIICEGEEHQGYTLYR